MCVKGDNLFLDSLEKEFMLYKNLNHYFSMESNDIQKILSDARAGILRNNKKK